MSTAAPNQISVKEAAKVAKDFVLAFYTDLGEPISNLMIEEVELSSDDETWQITVGFSRPQIPNDLLPQAAFSSWFKRDRIYKIVDINRETGVVEGMRIRQVEAL